MNGRQSVRAGSNLPDTLSSAPLSLQDSSLRGGIGVGVGSVLLWLFYPQCGVEAVPVPRTHSAYHKIWSLLSLFWSCYRTGYGHRYFRDPSFHSPTAQRCELTLFL